MFLNTLCDSKIRCCHSATPNRYSSCMFVNGCRRLQINGGTSFVFINGVLKWQFLWMKADKMECTSLRRGEQVYGEIRPISLNCCYLSVFSHVKICHHMMTVWVLFTSVFSLTEEKMFFPFLCFSHCSTATLYHHIKEVDQAFRENLVLINRMFLLAVLLLVCNL